MDKKVGTTTDLLVKLLFYIYSSEKIGAQEMGSTPYPGTIQDLTFSMFSISADQHLSANSLFWITVWITAVVRGPRLAVQASRFKLRGSSLVVAEPGLLGLVAGSGSDWLEVWGVGSGWSCLGPRAGGK